MHFVAFWYVLYLDQTKITTLKTSHVVENACVNVMWQLGFMHASCYVQLFVCCYIFAWRLWTCSTEMNDYIPNYRRPSLFADCEFAYSHLKNGHKWLYVKNGLFISEFRIRGPKWRNVSTANNEGNLCFNLFVF